MKCNAKVQVQEDKKRNRIRYLIYIPSRVVQAEKIKKGNIVDLEIENPNPDYIEKITVGNNFKKNGTNIQKKNQG